MLLAVREHRSPGTSGVRGRLYKLHAQVLAPILCEAFSDSTEGGMVAPRHLTEFWWSAIPKRPGADTAQQTRDLELPNEDTNMLGRMFVKGLDKAVAHQLKRRQQAFIAGGQIERNIVCISESVARAQTRQSECALYDFP